MTSRARTLALLAVLFLPLAALPFLAPIPQDLRYHVLADTRAMFGIPSFLNVVSNLPFLLVGAAGMTECLTRRGNGASRAWLAFFAGTMLAAFGSAYYHLAPDNTRLAWDRLPMTIAFMGLLAALVSEHLDARLEWPVLISGLAVGIASIAWWAHADDLRLYAWVQFGPLLAIVVILASFPPRFTHRAYLGWGLAFYMLAKVAELFDAAIYALTGAALSGHTLKHVIAAIAPLCLYLMVRRRVPIAASARAPAAA